MHSAAQSYSDMWHDGAVNGGAWRHVLERSRAVFGIEALVLEVRAGDGPRDVFSASALAGDIAAMLCEEAPNLDTPALYAAPATRRSQTKIGEVTRAYAGDSGAGAFRIRLHALGAPHELDEALRQEAAKALRAVKLRAHMAALEASAALSAAAFDLLPFGIGLVDAGLELKGHNLSFDAIIARGDGLRLRGRKLVCGTRHENEALAAHVGQALGGESAPALLRVKRAYGERPYVVRALGRPSAARANCLLLLLDPDRAPAADSGIWQAMFDLTACELIIAEGLVHGRRIPEIAAQRGVSVETVRTQAKRLYARLNVTSQAAATALLAQAAPFVAAAR